MRVPTLGCLVRALVYAALVLVLLASSLYALPSALLQMPDIRAEMWLERHVSPGMTEADVEAALGPPDERVPCGPERRCYPWGHEELAYTTWEPDVLVLLDKQGIVVHVRHGNADSTRWYGYPNFGRYLGVSEETVSGQSTEQ